MSDNTIQDLSKEANTVDVSEPEAQYMVQCEDVRLITSSLRPLIIDEGDTKLESRFAFRINAVVQDNQAHSYLEVQANYYIVGEPEELHGYQLRFVYMATFHSNQEIHPEELGDFAKMYTLSILWPYAREYANDQLRRTGEENLVLPIINPQVVTEQLVENDFIQVEIIDTQEESE